MNRHVRGWKIGGGTNVAVGGVEARQREQKDQLRKRRADSTECWPFTAGNKNCENQKGCVEHTDVTANTLEVTDLVGWQTSAVDYIFHGIFNLVTSAIS